MKRDLYSWLVYGRKYPVIGKLAYYLLKLLGTEIPCAVKIGNDFELAHGGFGVVIHPSSVIGDRVKIYPGVTIGRSDIYQPITQSNFVGIHISDDVILSPGAKVLCKEGVLVIGRGSIIGANAVLLNSTGVNEVWAGIPARNVGKRDDMQKESLTNKGKGNPPDLS